MKYIILIIFIAFIVLLLYKSIKVVRQSEVYIIERLGKFHKAADAGLTIIVPFIDTVRSIVSLKQQTMDIPPQEVITSDNVTITIDTVVFYKVVDPAKAVYEIQSLKKGIQYLSITTIRDIVGKMELDETFSSRDIINDKLRVVLDEATDAWGIKINRVELKNILPPREIQEAMEKQMRAERERRESILKAEGEKRSNILIAEGEKESAILRAEADKEAKIKAAEAEAESLVKVKQAEAAGIRLIKEAQVDDRIIALKSLETLSNMADGQATKIIVPCDLQNVATLGTTIKEMLNEKK